MTEVLDVRDVAARLGYLDTAAAADRIGVTEATLRQYRSREAKHPTRPPFPYPDALLAGHPAWLSSTVDAWMASRPGKGKGGGRPKKQDAAGQ
jgi:predicted DNA-binding transcriptional regulator AlpA